MFGQSKTISKTINFRFNLAFRIYKFLSMFPNVHTITIK